MGVTIRFHYLILATGLAIGLSSCGTTGSAKKNVLTPQPVASGDAVQLFRSVRVKQDMIPAHKVGRWKVRPMKPSYITIHSTQNFAACADAAQHARALKNGALRGNNSLGYLTWHFSVDDNKCVQHLPLNERGEHADFDGPGNRYSIGIEMCENKGSNRAVTVDRAARLAGVLMHTYGIPVNRVVPHYHWPRYKYKNNLHKNCPHFLLDNGKPGKTWRYFLARVDHYRKIASSGGSGGIAFGGGSSGPNRQALQAYFERGSMVRRGMFASIGNRDGDALR